MKKISIACVVAVLFGLPALAQGPACNEKRAERIARGELAQCIAAPAGVDLFVEVDALCECPAHGITVNAIARFRCNPNEECPPLAFLLGSVTLDCEYNVLESVCF